MADNEEIEALRMLMDAQGADIAELRKMLDAVDNDRLGLRDVTATTPATADEEFVVNHPWGRKVDKVVLVRASDSTILYQGPTVNTAKQIFLKASQASDEITIRPAE